MRLRAYIVGLALAACSQGSGITEAPADHSTKDVADDEDDEPLDEGPSDAGESDYPVFKFTGSGPVSCGGDVGMATAGVTTSMDGASMLLRTDRADMNCTVDKCEQGEVTSKVRDSIGNNSYVRVSDDELAKFKEEGVITGNFAIFASSVSYTKTSNPAEKRTFTFDKPLPVFPFPAKPARFDSVKDGATWTARTSGHYTMDVTVKMNVVAASESSITVVMSVEIAQDTDRSLYEMFPIPKQSTYTIDPKNRRITRIEVNSWFRGDQCKNKPGDVLMNYDLCQVTRDGEVDDLQACQ